MRPGALLLEAKSEISYYRALFYNYSKMVKVRNFNERLEESLLKLGAEVERQIDQPEVKVLPEREIVKRSLKSFGEQPAERETPPPQEQKQESSPPNFLPSYFKPETEAQAKAAVQELVELVFGSGLEKAIKKAKRYPPFIEDAFHDALTDRLLPELKKRGILK